MQHRDFSHTAILTVMCATFIFSLVSCQSDKQISSSTTTINSTTTTLSPIETTTIKNAQISPDASTNAKSQKSIEVSKEVFAQTFSQVEMLIKNLNILVSGHDYAGWTAYLSEAYRKKMSDPDYLLQLSKSATLQRINVNLKSLEDYFNYVVVPSRANLRLDDLVFLSETEVEAIMIVGNRRVTLYRLIKIGDQWLIGLS